MLLYEERLDKVLQLPVNHKNRVTFSTWPWRYIYIKRSPHRHLMNGWKFFHANFESLRRLTSFLVSFALIFLEHKFQQFRKWTKKNENISYNKFQLFIFFTNVLRKNITNNYIRFSKKNIHYFRLMSQYVHSLFKKYLHLCQTTNLVV